MHDRDKMTVWEKQECEFFCFDFFSFNYGHTYVHSAKCYIQGGTFPNRATSERSAVGRLV